MKINSAVLTIIAILLVAAVSYYIGVQNQTQKGTKLVDLGGVPAQGGSKSTTDYSDLGGVEVKPETKPVEERHWFVMMIILILVVSIPIGLFISPTYRFYKGQEENQVKKYNPRRLFFANKFLVLSVIELILFVVIRIIVAPDMILFKSSIPENLYILGFLWCFSWTTIGFAAIAYHWCYLPDSPLPDYITYYPLQLIAIAILVLAILCHYKVAEECLFYPLSASLCFTLGFYIDSIKSFLGR